MNRKVLIIDNYDSFTYNLVYLVRKVHGENLEVVRNDDNMLDNLGRFTHIILSPGPGIPSEAGKLLDVIKNNASKSSILGVCLGHQAIAEAFGGKLLNLQRVYHGESDTMKITKLNESLYRGMTDIFTAARYHSWVVDKNYIPEVLEVNCVDQKGQVMGISHREYNIKGVQFHPESYLSDYGLQMIRNFLKSN